MSNNEQPYHETEEYRILTDGFKYMSELKELTQEQHESYLEKVKVLLRHVVSNVIMEIGLTEDHVARGIKDLEREEYYLYAGEERER